jgi:hypothetical protein
MAQQLVQAHDNSQGRPYAWHFQHGYELQFHALDYGSFAIHIYLVQQNGVLCVLLHKLLEEFATSFRLPLTS